MSSSACSWDCASVSFSLDIESDVDQNPVPDLELLLLVVDEPYVDEAPDPANVGFREPQVCVYDRHDPSRYPQTHVMPPYASSLKVLSASIACPNASPPSLAGTRRCR